MSDRSRFTLYEKLRAAEREVSMRRSVYPERVARGTMTREEANREIAVMEAIADDYQTRIRKTIEPDLFDNEP